MTLRPLISPVAGSPHFMDGDHCLMDEDEGLSVHECLNERAAVIPAHAHDLASLYVVLDGRLFEQHGPATSEFPAGTVVFWAPGAVHENRVGDRTIRSIHIGLSPWIFAKVRSVFPDGGGTTALARELFEGAITHLVREVERQDAVSSLALEGVVYTILARANRVLHGRVAPSFELSRAMELIEREFHRSMRLDEIAEAARLSIKSLSARFESELGVSPLEHLRRVRLEHAANRLAATNEPLAAIALRSGFYDQPHLTREFRKWLGTTPAQYRQWHRAGAAKNRA